MKIAVISDTHFGMKRLGFHSGGVNTIEQDNYDAVVYAVESIEKNKPELVLHGGDVFENDNPSSLALINFLKFESGISSVAPFIMAAGNHDNRHLLEELSKRSDAEIVFEWGFQEFSFGDYHFFVVPHLDPKISDGKRDWLDEQKLFSDMEKAAKKMSGKKILLSHGILQSETEAFNIDRSSYNGSNVIPDRILKSFDYCFLGHNHSPSRRDIDGCVVIVPGSTVPDLFKTSLHDGLGVLYINLETGERERDTFIPRDIKKLEYFTEEDIEKVSEAITEGGIYLIEDYSTEGFPVDALQALRQRALLITAENRDNELGIPLILEDLPSLVEYAKTFEDKMPGVADRIGEDLKAL